VRKMSQPTRATRKMPIATKRTATPKSLCRSD
jgi:hypothetical protein